MLVLRRSAAQDMEAVRRIVAAAALPVDDLAPAATLQFWLAEEGTRLVGTVGLERYGGAGLLRSLVVTPARRGSGLGRRLVAALESTARAEGVELLALLTETAVPFFQRLGYTVAERATLPVAVHASAEFRSLCPASAICMVKHLTPAAERACD